MATTLNNCCYKRNLLFTELDVPIKRDGCHLIVHNKRSGLAAYKVVIVSTENRSSKYFCDLCNIMVYAILLISIDYSVVYITVVDPLRSKIYIDVHNLNTFSFIQRR